MHPTMKLAWGSVGVSLTVAGLKFAAWWSTGSVELYSDALECIVNVLGACTALAALWISCRPADTGHPYGHQKVDIFRRWAEGLMVLAASGAILHEVYVTWANPHRCGPNSARPSSTSTSNPRGPRRPMRLR